MTDLDILDLLPQRPPFIMVDKLTYFDLQSAKTVFTVHADNLFCVEGAMEEAGLVENIAQTCAAHTGFKQWIGKEKDSRHCEARSNLLNNESADCFVPRNDDIASCYDVQPAEKVKIGVIAMIQSLEMKRRPLVGETLKTSMVIEEEIFSTTFVRSEVMIADETIATCRMRLFLTDKTPD